MKEVLKDENIRKKLSTANSGERNPFFGKHHSEELKNKWKEMRKGLRYVNNGLENKMIKSEELDIYLKQGYVLGMIKRKK